MKLSLLLTILVVLALIVVAALTLRAVIATQAVIYRGEALQTGYTGQQETQAVMDPCGAELAGQSQGQDQPATKARERIRAAGIDPCKQDLNLRAPLGVEYAYMILRPQQCRCPISQPESASSSLELCR
jgi:hypothetical protein